MIIRVGTSVIYEMSEPVPHNGDDRGRYVRRLTFERVTLMLSHAAVLFLYINCLRLVAQLQGEELNFD